MPEPPRWVWDPLQRKHVEVLGPARNKPQRRGGDKERDGGFTVTDLKRYLRCEPYQIQAALDKLKIDVGPAGRANATKRRVLTPAEARLVMAEIFRQRGDRLNRGRRKRMLEQTPEQDLPPVLRKPRGPS